MPETKLLKEMIRLNSVNPPGNEEAVARLIGSVFQENGIDTEIRILEDKRANLVARLKGSGVKKHLIFTGHLDTVPPGDMPWDFDPYGAVEHEGRIYGRGASDMKGGLAAMVSAMLSIAKSKVPLEGDLVLAATVGEEVDCKGAKALVQDGLLKDAGAMVVGEPSNGEVFTSHKGALWLDVVSYGKTAHGSMPDQGINAILHMNRFINALLNLQFSYVEDELVGGPTLNLSVIAGGVKTNVVPDVCHLEVDIRTVPGQSHLEIVNEINSVIARVEQDTAARFELRILNDKPPVNTSIQNDFVKLAVNTASQMFKKEFVPQGVRYYTDASTFIPASDQQLPFIIYGPGDEKLAHQPNEYVEKSKYLDAIKFYQELALKYLAPNYTTAKTP